MNLHPSSWRRSVPKYRLHRPCLTLLALLTLNLAWTDSSSPAAEAARTNTPCLTLESIFTTGEFETAPAPSFRWLEKKAHYVTFEDASEGHSGREFVRYDPEKGERQVIAPAHWFIPPGSSSPLAVEDYELSDNGARLLIYTNGKRVWRTNSRGDYWVLDLSSRELRKLGGEAPPSSLMFAQFSPDGQQACYVRENNLYVQSLVDWRITALTTNGSATLVNGTFDWVYEEELFLRRGFLWSPDSSQIAYWQLDVSGVAIFHLINNTDELYPRLIPISYPKTGQQNAAARVGVVRAEGGETTWLNVPGDPRNHYLARMDWSGTELALQQFNRIQNTNRFLLANPSTGDTRCILEETDEAWVENENAFRWLENGQSFVWLSERDGWRHAYRISRSGGDTTLLTPGEFDVINIVSVDEAGGWLYFLASPENPTQQYLYRAPLRGGDSERLSPKNQPGTHTYQISPGSRWAFHTYSSAETPPVKTLVRLPEHEVVKTFTENRDLREKLSKLPPCPTQFFRVPVADGVALDAFCMRPPDFDPTRQYPVLIYVYGEPAGATVMDSWKGSSHLWHRMLAQEGYIILSFDNRGTHTPRGRAWRKSIYRQIGLLASADQAAALQAVARQWSFIDTNRVAIWGWSGGGSMTLNAVFRYPELYQTAMSIASVPNQRLYDTIYQERYMGLPSDNPDGYREGSPINFAHQLQGNLLLVHGTGDDNCHYQGAEELVNELVRHNKPFTLMAYPNRSHGIFEGENTTRHLFETLTRFLHTHTPPGAKAIQP